ncbi:hypothetical protein CPLU01_05961 [Colletotrichum plurivorum]|uniref:Uncharacterized protein n=1 Tax=Colletotrichum plurivorum TaxID=2175906 RepID=A0A8H6NGI0_9PEZI|nr:hypothetical protein CPLU01_05961 [Colletotrichum plurivorum]
MHNGCGFLSKEPAPTTRVLDLRPIWRCLQRAAPASDRYQVDASFAEVQSGRATRNITMLSASYYQGSQKGYGEFLGKSRAWRLPDSAVTLVVGPLEMC